MRVNPQIPYNDTRSRWVLAMDSPRGTLEQNLTLTDVGGKVAAELSGGRGGTVSITDIIKSGDDVVLSFEQQGRGGSATVVLTLSLDGDTLKATQDNGRFSMTGTGRGCPTGSRKSAATVNSSYPTFCISATLSSSRSRCAFSIQRCS